MAKVLAAFSLGTIALVLPTLGMSFAPSDTIATKRDEALTVDRHLKTDRLPVVGSTVIVKTTAIRSPALPGTSSNPYAARPLTDCEPVVSPLADARSGWRIRECST